MLAAREVRAWRSEGKKEVCGRSERRAVETGVKCAGDCQNSKIKKWYISRLAKERRKWHTVLVVSEAGI